MDKSNHFNGTSLYKCLNEIENNHIKQTPVQILAFWASHLLVFQLLLLQKPLQVLHVVVFKVLDETAGCLQALLDGETCCFIP